VRKKIRIYKKEGKSAAYLRAKSTCEQVILEAKKNTSIKYILKLQLQGIVEHILRL